MDETTLGRRVRRLRLERKWSQLDLADRAGVHKMTIQGIETGKHKSAKLATISALARVFNVPLSQLLRGVSQ